ncbi:MAG: cupredoxin domain-containing protein [Dehalococcoidia bacterium]
MKRTWLIGAAFALAFALPAFAACGGSSDESDGPATAVAPPEGVPAGAAFVDQDDLKFKPNSLSVAAGEKIYFANSETAVHTVTVDGKNLSGNMRKGDIFEWTVETAGEYKITCDFHPQMKATITVN